MKTRKIGRIITLTAILFMLFFLFSTIAAADAHLPVGLLKIIEYNEAYTAEFAIKVTFIIAFMAGILAFLSPCIFPLMTAYFTVTFKEKKNITKMAFFFFIGFSK